MTVSFASILNYLMIVMNISNTRLARELSVHPSLITRWRSGGRVPPKNSNYIDKFAALLAGLGFTTSQREAITEFFSLHNLAGDAAFDDMPKCIAQALQGARQIYQEQQAASGPVAKPSLQLLLPGPGATKKEAFNLAGLKGEMRASCETVLGPGQLISAVSRLLLEASSNDKISKKELLMLSISHHPAGDSTPPGRLLGLSGLLSRLLMRQWWITVLINQPGNSKKLVGYDDYLAQFADYEHFSASIRSANAPPMLYPELVAIPGQFALLAFSSGFAGELDAGFIFRDGASVAYFCDSFYYMYAESTPVTLLTGQPGRVKLPGGE